MNMNMWTQYNQRVSTYGVAIGRRWVRTVSKKPNRTSYINATNGLAATTTRNPCHFNAKRVSEPSIRFFCSVPTTPSLSPEIEKLNAEYRKAAEELATPRVCLGCGAAFQTEFEHKDGFIKKDILERYVENAKKEITSRVKDITKPAANPRPSLPAAPIDLRVTKDRTRDVIEQEIKDHGHEVWTPSQIKAEMKRIRALREQGLASPLHNKTRSSQENHLTALVSLPPLRCVRCYTLIHYGYSSGNTSVAPLADFTALLRSRFLARGGRSNVILKMVDVTDLHGSIIQDFSRVAGGRNPTIVVANKIDLLPEKYGEDRLRAWLKAELTRMDVHFVAVQLVSAKTGDGIPGLMRKAAELAANHALGKRDIYIVGSINVGKSSLISKLIEMKYIQSRGTFESVPIDPQEEEKQSKAPSEEDLVRELWESRFKETDDVKGTEAQEVLVVKKKPKAIPAPSKVQAAMISSGGSPTQSIMPGTTLGFVGFPLIPAREGTIFDSPGLITATITTSLLYDELKSVLPSRRIIPITYRLKKGQSILIGGLARLDMVDGLPFYFTIFTSHNVSVHVTSTDRLEAYNKEGQRIFFRKHVGKLLAPPYTFNRYEELGLDRGTRYVFDIQGRGWMEASDDIVFPGLGWVAITGCASARVRAVMSCGSSEVPVRAYAREPLLPLEVAHSRKKFFGGSPRPLRLPKHLKEEEVASDEATHSNVVSETDNRETPQWLQSSSPV